VQQRQETAHSKIEPHSDVIYVMTVPAGRTATCRVRPAGTVASMKPPAPARVGVRMQLQPV
jgi:hypothetical protein